MDWLLPIATVAGAMLVGAMSPGPSFVVVARTALVSSRLNGFAAALGMGAGGALFALTAVMGLVILLTSIPVLHLAFKVLGALYLIFLAYKIWVTSRQSLEFKSNQSKRTITLWQSFVTGFTTQISNPKTAIVYASIFAVALPSSFPYWFGVVCISLIFLIEAGWYSIIAVVFSAEKARSGYLASKTVLDRLAATTVGILGLKILSDIR